MRRWKRAAAVALAGILSAASAFTVLAVEKPTDMDDATWARLQDNVLEYDEIENLVVCYNPYYRQAADQIAVQLAPLETAVEDLRQEARELRSEARDAKEDGDMLTYMTNTYMVTAIEGILDGSNGAPGLKRALNSANSQTKTPKNQVRRMMTSTVQQLVIGYHQALASKPLVDAAAEYAEAAQQSARASQSLGLATMTDVQRAEAGVVSARNQQQSLDDTITTLRQNLCVMTGWSYNAQPEIGAVPAPDLTRIETMNPEVDITQAIGYNGTIISQRAMSGKGEVNHSIKFRSLDETEAKIKNQLQVLYQAVLAAKATYDGAKSSLENSQLTMDSSQRMYDLGMISRMEYLQMRMGYLQQKMVYDQAQLSLTQAIANYDWALYGVITLD